ASRRLAFVLQAAHAAPSKVDLHAAALGARLRQRSVEGDPVAIGPVRAPKEDAAFLRALLEDLAAVGRTLHADAAGERLGLAAVMRGRVERPEATRAQLHLHAVAAELVRRVFGELLWQRPRFLVLGVVGARQESPEASLLDDHRVA